MSSLSFDKKAKNTFYQLFVTGISFMLLIILVGVWLYPTLFLFGKSLGNTFEVVCGCDTSLSLYSNPFLTGGLLLLGAFIATILFYIVTRIFKTSRSTNNFVNKFLIKKKSIFSLKLRKVINKLGLHGRVIQVDGGDSVVFCYGFLKPKICISSVLVESLRFDELLAVIAHEKHHLVSKEPLRILVVGLVSRMLFFVPGVKKLSQHYMSLSEIAADQYATSNFTNKTPLAQALSKVLESKQKETYRQNLALSFFGLITEERIKQLEDSNNRIQNLFKARLGLGVFLVSCLSLGIGFFLVFNSPVLASENNIGSCDLNQSIAPTECRLVDMPVQECVMIYNLSSNGVGDSCR